MATKYEIIKTAFKERVLPHFPKAERRFRKHFRASHDIIKSFKDHIHLDFAFTLLGLKPLSLVEDWQPSIALTKILSEAGLEINIHSKPRTHPGTEVFDPELAAEPLSKMLNWQVKPEDVKEAVKRAYHSLDHSHELFGYPQPFPWLSLLDLIYTTRSYLRIQNTGPEYFSSFGCVITDIEAVYPMLPPLAAAAAIVEEIRDAPLDIISEVKIDKNRIFFTKLEREVNTLSLTIQRTAKTAEWIVE
jgi:hypothetical protein